MHTNKTLAVVVDERDEIGLLLGVHFRIASGEEKHGVEIVQVLGVVFQLSLGRALQCRCEAWCSTDRSLAQALNRSHGMGNCLVPVAFLLANYQEMLRRVRDSQGLGWAQTAERGGRYCNDRD